MPLFKPFKGYRPKASEAKRFASLPFDSVTSNDVPSVSESQFLKVTRPDLFNETLSSDVNAQSKEALHHLIATGEYIQDADESFYLYGLTADAKSYYGLVGCLSVEDYKNGRLKYHELTRNVRANDLVGHIINTGFHTEPVFGSIRYNLDVDLIINDCLFLDPEFDFVSADGVTHQFWRISNPSKIKRLKDVFANDVESIYIADDNRCAASVAVFDLLSVNDQNSDGSSVFLASVFPMHQLQGKPYHRIISLQKDKESALIDLLAVQFDVFPSEKPFFPTDQVQVGLYINSSWYQLKYKTHQKTADPVTAFNETVVLGVLLIENIQDAEKNGCVSSVGNIDVLLSNPSELEGKAIFTLPALSVQQIFDLSDAGIILPSKSTWFDPKPRSGLVIHSLDI